MCCVFYSQFNICFMISFFFKLDFFVLLYLIIRFFFHHQTICKPAPFSYERDAIDERDRIDYTNRITYNQAKSGKTTRRIRVYADGIYDLFHQGHARQLMQVGLCIFIVNFQNIYITFFDCLG